MESLNINCKLNLINMQSRFELGWVQPRWMLNGQ